MKLRRPFTSRFVCTAAAVAAFGTACASPGPTIPADGLIPLGNYGGEQSGVIVGDTAAHVHIGCTYGDVSGRIQVDANGAFDVEGSYLLRAYPIAVGPTMPARFTGKLDGNKLTVTVVVNDTVNDETVTKGPVTVLYGEDPQMGPCPICRRPIVTK